MAATSRTDQRRKPAAKVNLKPEEQLRARQGNDDHVARIHQLGCHGGAAEVARQLRQPGLDELCEAALLKGAAGNGENTKADGIALRFGIEGDEAFVREYPQ